MPAPPTWRGPPSASRGPSARVTTWKRSTGCSRRNSRNRLDAIITFAHLSPEIIAMVVEKFVLQLEAQLADRNVTIELTDEATKWLIANGYDELMGARPMARVIQEHIKKALADEVLFGRLKGGGHVRVIVVTDEAGNSKLGFDYPDGPVKPRPEKLPEPRRAK